MTRPDFAAIAAMPGSTYSKAQALTEALRYYGFWADFYGPEVKIDTGRMIAASQPAPPHDDRYNRAMDAIVAEARRRGDADFVNWMAQENLRDWRS